MGWVGGGLVYIASWVSIKSLFSVELALEALGQRLYLVHAAGSLNTQSKVKHEFKDPDVPLTSELPLNITLQYPINLSHDVNSKEGFAIDDSLTSQPYAKHLPTVNRLHRLRVESWGQGPAEEFLVNQRRPRGNHRSGRVL
jgi:hypothetical protein